MIKLEKGSFILGSQNYTFTTEYEYAILGKKLPDSKMTISYKVLDSGRNKIETFSKEVTPKNITDNSFQIDLPVPFKRTKILPLTYEKTSYITDVVITDGKGYKCEGIYDSTTGTILTEIRIDRK